MTIIRSLRPGALVLSLALNTALAILWYRPFLFGRRWAALTGRSVSAPPDPAKMAVGILCGALFVLAMAVLVEAMDLTRFVHALGLAGLVGLGLIAAIALPIALYNGFGMPLFLIDTGLSVAGALLTSVVLVSFR